MRRPGAAQASNRPIHWHRIPDNIPNESEHQFFQQLFPNASLRGGGDRVRLANEGLALGQVGLLTMANCSLQGHKKQNVEARAMIAHRRRRGGAWVLEARRNNLLAIR